MKKMPSRPALCAGRNFFVFILFLLSILNVSNGQVLPSTTHTPVVGAVGYFDAVTPNKTLGSSNIFYNPAISNVSIITGSGGLPNLFSLQNFSSASVGNGGLILFSANRTTGGMTDIAGIGGMISNIGNTGFLGELTFFTASGAAPSERMRLDHNGNLGIGITSPTSILHTVASGIKNCKFYW